MEINALSFVTITDSTESGTTPDVFYPTEEDAIEAAKKHKEEYEESGYDFDTVTDDYMSGENEDGETVVIEVWNYDLSESMHKGGKGND